MKTIVTFLLSTTMLVCGTINFGTGVGGLEGNSLTGVNVATIPAGVYYPPLGTSVWESTQADSTNPEILNGTEVSFWFNFVVPGVPIHGIVGVMVDDSARGWLNGQYLYDNLNSIPGVNCAATKPNCREPLWVDISPYLLPGNNEFKALVRQDSGAQFALDIYGKVVYQETIPFGPVQAPEPEAVMLVGAGIVGILVGKKGGRG